MSDAHLYGSGRNSFCARNRPWQAAREGARFSECCFALDWRYAIDSLNLELFVLPLWNSYMRKVYPFDRACRHRHVVSARPHTYYTLLYAQDRPFRNVCYFIRGMDKRGRRGYGSHWTLYAQLSEMNIGYLEIDTHICTVTTCMYLVPYGLAVNVGICIRICNLKPRRFNFKFSGRDTLVFSDSSPTAPITLRSQCTTCWIPGLLLGYHEDAWHRFLELHTTNGYLIPEARAFKLFGLASFDH